MKCSLLKTLGLNSNRRCGTMNSVREHQKKFMEELKISRFDTLDNISRLERDIAQAKNYLESVEKGIEAISHELELTKEDER